MWRKPLATDGGGGGGGRVGFKVLTAPETNTIEYELEFGYDMRR